MFITDSPTFAQFNGEMCRRCIDVRCDAFPGACEPDLVVELQKSIDKARLDNPKTRKLMREAFEAGWTCGVSDLERSFDEWFAEYRER